METATLKRFASIARTLLLREVSARLGVVLSEGSTARVEAAGAVAALARAVSDAGGGKAGRAAVVDRVAYTWFNRVVALRFMDANGFTSVGVVSPASGRTSGQPAVLADAKAGHVDAGVVPTAIAARVSALLGGQLASPDPQGEAYGLLLLAYCRHWNKSMPFMFEADADYSELLIPSDLLAEDSVMARAVTAMTPEVCQDVEVIGWLYQFYIADRKDEVFAGFKKNEKAGPAEIPAATQLFTPHWIVRYLVENSLGRLWLLNHPTSGLRDQMEYYIDPVDEETDYLKVTSPEELKVIDPACGSGHMLTYAFDLLHAIYEEEGYAPTDIPGLILQHNLYGTEIDPRSGSLAAFALTMKARQRKRTFFAKPVQPKICVLEPIRFTPEELDGLVTPGGIRADEEAFLNQFEDADTFGALIRADETLIEPIRTHLALSSPTDLLARDVHARAERIVAQAEYLSVRYNVVVANPPYMGSGAMSPALVNWAKENYPASKIDLFAMFIERCLGLVKRSGYVGMIAMDSWMFLAAYAKFRQALLRGHSFETVAHLGSGAFDSIGGAVVSTAAFVARAQGDGSTRTVFLRAVDGNEAAKSNVLTSETTPPGSQMVRAASDFLGIPNSPILYWAAGADVQALQSGPYLGDLVTAREGLTTGSNEKFLRRWWEVSQDSIGIGVASSADAALSTHRWFPYQKGGSSRRWYGNFEYVVNWSDNGREMRQFADPRTGRIRSHNYNGEFAFRAGFTWSGISGADFAVRHIDGGFMFDAKGPMAFSQEGHELAAVEAFLNSATATRLMNLLAPRLDYKIGHVLSLPIRVKNSSQLEQLVSTCIAESRREWDSDECSIDFSSPPFLGLSKELKHAIDLAEEVRRSGASRLEEAERQINAIVGEAYGDSDGEILTTEPCRVEARAEVGNLVEQLLSYAVGCMLGRYSVDARGLILTNQGDTLEDHGRQVPAASFMPDADNVIPITGGEWFEDDIVSRFRHFLRVAFGDEHFEENLRFIEESLGKDIRSYFLKDFFKDHVQRYKKRPIYWLFSSPKGSFNALIYMHRYTPSTVSTVLNEYLREFQAKLAAELASRERDAVAATDPKARNAAAKEADRLRKVLIELNEYEHDVLYPLASRQISIDLDDGVKANYPKFGAALKKIVGLESTSE